jgi:hypothetical protein
MGPEKDKPSVVFVKKKLMSGAVFNSLILLHNKNLVREMITDRMLLTGSGYLDITSYSHIAKEQHVSPGRRQHVFVQVRGE